jgi:mannose-6-phosphate isomerase-like protein (cupin superfamily)
MIRRSSRAALGGALAMLACAACRGENTGTVAGPPLTIAPVDASTSSVSALTDAQAVAPPPASSGEIATADASPPAEPPLSPITARFVDLGPKSREELKFTACEQYFVAVARGKAKAAGEALKPGDLLVAQGAGAFDVTGDGLALIASARPRVCEPSQATTIHKKVVRANHAPELTFAGGKMHAHLDAESDVSQLAYFGRLDGTAPVAEHAHDGAWELLCAVEGAGTFTLAGEEHRLGPKQIIAVPPSTKHAWKPDEGVKLVAFQMYSPPGPEQRFKKLAAEGAAGAQDAGAKK